MKLYRQCVCCDMRLILHILYQLYTIPRHQALRLLCRCLLPRCVCFVITTSQEKQTQQPTSITQRASNKQSTNRTIKRNTFLARSTRFQCGRPRTRPVPLVRASEECRQRRAHVQGHDASLKERSHRTEISRLCVAGNSSASPRTSRLYCICLFGHKSIPRRGVCSILDVQPWGFVCLFGDVNSLTASDVVSECGYVDIHDA